MVWRVLQSKQIWMCRLDSIGEGIRGGGAKGHRASALAVNCIEHRSVMLTFFGHSYPLPPPPRNIHVHKSSAKVFCTNSTCFVICFVVFFLSLGAMCLVAIHVLAHQKTTKHPKLTFGLLSCRVPVVNVFVNPKTLNLQKICVR